MTRRGQTKLATLNDAYRRALDIWSRLPGATSESYRAERACNKAAHQLAQFVARKFKPLPRSRPRPHPSRTRRGEAVPSDPQGGRNE